MPKKSKLDNPLDVYLNQRGTNRSSLTKKSGLSNGWLYDSTKKSIKRHHLGFFERIAKALDVDTNELIEELTELEEKMVKEGKLSRKYLDTIEDQDKFGGE